MPLGIKCQLATVDGDVTQGEAFYMLFLASQLPAKLRANNAKLECFLIIQREIIAGARQATGVT